MSVAMPEPSMPSRLSRRPATSMIRRRVAGFCCLPYRAMRASTGRKRLALRPPLLYYGRNSIARRPPEMVNTQPLALVTGASSGIGKAAALAFVQAGFDVVGTSRDASRVTPQRGVTFFDLDVTSDESVSTLVRGVIERFGCIDVLVNNGAPVQRVTPR